jgi:hypothetical protein
LIPIYRQIYVFKETELKIYERNFEDKGFEEGKNMNLKSKTKNGKE